jgi:hypothetical protein
VFDGRDNHPFASQITRVKADPPGESRLQALELIRLAAALSLFLTVFGRISGGPSVGPPGGRSVHYYLLFTSIEGGWLEGVQGCAVRALYTGHIYGSSI